MPKLKNKGIVCIIFLAFILRLAISHYQYSGDIKNHFVWANSFLSSSFNFYNHHVSGYNDPNYPPLAIYLFALSRQLYKVSTSLVLFLNKIPLFPSSIVPFILSENVQYAFLKLPGIISDLVIGYLIYIYKKKENDKKALFWSSLFLFNPATIYVSTVWGQIESITTVFLVLSYLNISLPISIIYFCLATLTKQTALWVLPIYLIYWLEKQGVLKVVGGVLVAIFVFFVSYLPFGLLPLSALSNFFQTLNGSSTVVSDAAWNLWSFFYQPGTEDSLKILFISIRTFSIISLTTILFLTTKYILKNRKAVDYANILTLWSVFVFILQTRVHERHLYFAPVFLLLSKLNYKIKTVTFIILSIYYYANLFTSLKLPFI